jgi:hypothetical protein
MLPATISFPLSAGITGYIVGGTLRYKALNVLGFVLIVTALGAFTALQESSPVGLQIGLLFVAGVGCGIPFITKVFMVQGAVNEEDVFMATAIVSTATSIGECFGVAVASAAFQGRWQYLLEQKLKHTKLSIVVGSSDAEKSAELINSLSGKVQEIYKHIAVESFRTVWTILAVLAGVALILVLVGRDMTLRGDHLDRESLDVRESRD